ncbi:hypothetical protein C8J57DRAFT_1314512 [Mycena rebaudengoi]|nr:hypothetical protein C8J57DRAFT_1314512 [Mycena rebaudengoi]
MLPLPVGVTLNHAFILALHSPTAPRACPPRFGSIGAGQRATRKCQETMSRTSNPALSASTAATALCSPTVMRPAVRRCLMPPFTIPLYVDPAIASSRIAISAHAFTSRLRRRARRPMSAGAHPTSFPDGIASTQECDLVSHISVRARGTILTDRQGCVLCASVNSM